MLTAETGHEHALVKLANGERAIVSGNAEGIVFEQGQVECIFGHTHIESTVPSAADIDALQQLKQSQQTIVRDGQQIKVRNPDIGGAGGVAQIGTKLEYVFGKATGAAHNIERSTSMLKQLQRVGIFDNKAGRSLLKSHLEKAYKSAEAVRQSNGRYLRESLLMGPNGALKVKSVWEGEKLITVTLFGAK